MSNPTPLQTLVAACDALAADKRYAAKTRDLAAALRAWAVSETGRLLLEKP